MNKENLVILVDSQEKRNSHIIIDFANKGIKCRLKGLNFGDYSFIYDDVSYEKMCSVERKANLLEIAGNFCKGRRRFENEFIRANESNAKFTLLIEDAKAKEKICLRQSKDMDKTLTDAQRQKGSWKSKFTANSMIASIKSWKAKYNFDLIFCDKKDSADRILEVFENYINNKEW
jgi:hypothetical protein